MYQSLTLLRFRMTFYVKLPNVIQSRKGREKTKFNIFGETISMFAGFQRMWAMFAFISLYLLKQ